MTPDCERPELVAQELRKAKDATIANMERLKDLKNRNDQIQEIITQAIIDKLEMGRHLDTAIRISSAPDGCKSKNRSTDTHPHVPLSLIVISLILITGAQLMAASPSESSNTSPCIQIENAIDTDDPMNKARDYQVSGDYGKAYDYWSMSIAEYERKGERPITALGEKAYCAYRLGNYKCALKICNELERYDPRSSKAAYIRGEVYEKQQNWSEASKEYRLALMRGDKYASKKLRKVEGKS